MRDCMTCAPKVGVGGRVFERGKWIRKKINLALLYVDESPMRKETREKKMPSAIDKLPREIQSEGKE